MCDCSFPAQGNAELVLHITAAHSFSANSRQNINPSQYLGSQPLPPHVPGHSVQGNSSSLASSMAGMSLGGFPVPSRNSFNPNSYPSFPPAFGFGHQVPNHHFDHGYGYGHHWGKELKSGQDRSCAPKAKVHIVWPHEAFDQVLGQRSFSYSELTGPALAAGSIATLFHTPEFLLHTHESIQVYLEHLSVLFHALSFSNNLSAVLDYNRAVLQLVEAGAITWSRSHRATLEGLRINFLASLRVQPPNPTSSQPLRPGDSKDSESKRRSEAERETCKDYQDGKCDKSGDHDGKKHYCKYCWFKRCDKALHQAVDCPFGPKIKKK